jgi:hypothetical protein
MNYSEATIKSSGAIAGLVEADFKDVPDICAHNRANGKSWREISNWLQLALAGVKMTSLQIRYFKQPLEARTYLAKARWAAQQAAQTFHFYEERSEIRKLPISNFEFKNAIFTAWLYGDWELAHTFARLTSHPELKNKRLNRKIEGGIPYLFANAALDDLPAYEIRQPDLEIELAFRAGRFKYWRKYYTYPKLIHAILHRDEVELEALLAQCDKLYYELGKDRAGEDLPPIEGPHDFNPLMIEYRATALAMLALHRGMKVEFNSEVIPVNTFKEWQASWQK